MDGLHDLKVRFVAFRRTTVPLVNRRKSIFSSLDTGGHINAVFGIVIAHFELIGCLRKERLE